MHAFIPFLLITVVSIVLLEMLASRLRIAYPIVLVLAGLGISFIPGLPAIHIDPDLIFFLFLPPLLFEASWSISIKEMFKWRRIIGSFAFLVVFFTAFSVAIFTHWYIPGFTLALGFLLGGIVSPPDAVSTGAIMKFVKIPRSTSAILEGESLLNDASSLIIFRFALIAISTGQFVWKDASLSFLWMVLGGTAVGLILAWVCMKALKILPTDAPSDTAVTLIAPYLMYWVAETLHCSGVLAVVAGGLFMSSRRLVFLSSSSRIKGNSVWEVLVFIINGIIFLMIGLALPDIEAGVQQEGISLFTAFGYGVAVTAVLILARIVCAYAALLATYLFRRQNMPAGSNTRMRLLMPIVLGWTGMRGVVSLAAALSIPVLLDDGSTFPHRSLILFITFIVILLTLVVQGLTLPVIIRRINPFVQFSEKSDKEIMQGLQLRLKQYTHDYIMAKSEDFPEQKAAYSEILAAWKKKMEPDADPSIGEKRKAFYLELLRSQRGFLQEINKEDGVSEEAVRKQLYQIDLEEERLNTSA